MIITPLALAPAALVASEPIADARGFFARVFCADEFARNGLPDTFVQCNISANTHRGTLRGLHYQAHPAAEGKLVRCIKGAVFDVLLDLRPNSPTHGQWHAVELSAATGLALYIPPGFAHGFQTLADDTHLFYQMTAPHHPNLARGLRWNDSTFAIPWPIPTPILSPRDAAWPDYAEGSG